MERPLRHAASRTQTRGREPRVCGGEFHMCCHDLVAACQTVETYLERCKRGLCPSVLVNLGF